ncbi:MAG: DUF3592 domain-containing protein [Anaerolineae bacterium]|jgi:hypothetical protein|nr:DUF3592 domain-containing protein [Anaerolineae bacterium]
MDPNELFALLFGGGMIMTVVIVIFSVCLSVLCTVVPIGAVVWFILKRKKQRDVLQQASLAWRSTQGRVLKSRVEVSGGEHTSVSPYVLYEYEVHGQVYQSVQIRAGDRFMRSGSSRDAYETVDLYPPGASVTVYYDPANPAESALERA